MIFSWPKSRITIVVYCSDESFDERSCVDKCFDERS